MQDYSISRFSQVVYVRKQKGGSDFPSCCLLQAFCHVNKALSLSITILLIMINYTANQCAGNRDAYNLIILILTGTLTESPHMGIQPPCPLQ